MYICLCNGYRENDVRQAAREGAENVDVAYTRLGGPPCCRRCVPTAESVIEEERSRASARRRFDEAALPLPNAVPA